MTTYIMGPDTEPASDPSEQLTVEVKPDQGSGSGTTGPTAGQIWPL